MSIRSLKIEILEEGGGTEGMKFRTDGEGFRKVAKQTISLRRVDGEWGLIWYWIYFVAAVIVIKL